MANNAPVIPGAIMLDRVLASIQEALVDRVSWLDVAFGRAQRIVRTTASGRRITTPNVYCGGWNGHGPNDYIEVSPDAEIGNFSFFSVEDPQTIGPGPWLRTVQAPFGLVVWFDLRRVYGSATNRNTEKLKEDVLKVLTGRSGWAIPAGHIELAQIYEQSQNIYRGYSLDEVDNQFLMHPYGGFRIEGVVSYTEPCDETLNETPDETPEETSNENEL